jgi:hypothetical protein
MQKISIKMVDWKKISFFFFFSLFHFTILNFFFLIVYHIFLAINNNLLIKDICIVKSSQYNIKKIIEL